MFNQKANKIILILIAVCSTAFFLYWQLYNLDQNSLNVDSANYYYQAIRLVGGGKPFLDFIENKNPGIYYLLSPIAIIYHWNLSGAIIFFAILGLTNILLTVLLLNIFIRDKIILAICSLILTVTYSHNIITQGSFFVMTEIPHLTFSLLGYYLYFRKKNLFIVGIVLGLAFMMRQTALTDIAVITIYHLSSCLIQKKGFKFIQKPYTGEKLLEIIKQTKTR